MELKDELDIVKIKPKPRQYRCELSSVILADAAWSSVADRPS